MKTTKKALLSLIALVLALGIAAPAVSAQETGTPSEIKEITYQKVDDQLQVFIKIEGPFTFETLEVQAPQRLVLDFHSVTKISAAPVVEVNDVGVTSIRTGQYQPEVARVVFDLGDKAPSHSLTQVENGLKVVFWIQAEPPQETPKPAEVKEEPVKPAETKPAEVKTEKPATEGRRSFFVRVAGGMAFYAMPDTSTTKDLVLYAETGSIKETYSLKTTWNADLVIGKYVTDSIRVGVGASMQSLNETTAIEASIPHPFLVNTPRTVTFPSEELNHSLMNIYVFGLFTLVRTDKFEASLGPMLGSAKADYESLQDFSFEDNSPFASTDIVITDKTIVKESVSGLSAGAWLALQYKVSGNLTLGLDARLVYFNAKVANLGKRANLSTLNLLLGVQYNF
jgi:hypothetical protein